MRQKKIKKKNKEAYKRGSDETKSPMVDQAHQRKIESLNSGLHVAHQTLIRIRSPLYPHLSPSCSLLYLSLSIPFPQPIPSSRSRRPSLPSRCSELALRYKCTHFLLRNPGQTEKNEPEHGDKITLNRMPLQINFSPPATPKKFDE
jgi:hypothetical protein